MSDKATEKLGWSVHEMKAHPGLYYIEDAAGAMVLRGMGLRLAEQIVLEHNSYDAMREALEKAELYMNTRTDSLPKLEALLIVRAALALARKG